MTYGRKRVDVEGYVQPERLVGSADKFLFNTGASVAYSLSLLTVEKYVQ